MQVYEKPLSTCETSQFSQGHNLVSAALPEVLCLPWNKSLFRASGNFYHFPGQVVQPVFQPSSKECVGPSSDIRGRTRTALQMTVNVRVKPTVYTFSQKNGMLLGWWMHTRTLDAAKLSFECHTARSQAPHSTNLSNPGVWPWCIGHHCWESDDSVMTQPCCDAGREGIHIPDAVRECTVLNKE